MIVIASGTFDHLHEGHHFFLEQAFKIGYVLIGLCSDEMIADKQHPEKIYPYEKRKKDLKEYLTSKGYSYRKDYTIKKIRNKIGFADNIEDIDAIVVTPEVKENAEEINEIRREKGWKDLQIVEVPLLKDEKGIISSTRIRRALTGD
ncbi:MAG: pantetheine-phosphate adenylyltransferase [Theionarchaea archaeon]|nr:pantetheine-phosphate adenylyltransferase [Theionarchaea archaeon]MBU7001430.1 pantetheine-phosphate adenylyltransferase [Theionarchaea archaeon]MBU7021891.1 pantetheine-phosphate adenylyltransferase [Theionarchaea archaeon]MBU7034343.1 pantetheine-phosphate adenylyltransferase [Theionarchaea archaeon]MBU7040308.1 pantetheine-phosphate adenylyltransferase [Theionarchaea archaeon]